jgi:hypothetical protein
MFSGDPLDRSLRNVEIEVMIPKKMREKAKEEKCSDEVKGKFHQCTDPNHNELYVNCKLVYCIVLFSCVVYDEKSVDCFPVHTS